MTMQKVPFPAPLCPQILAGALIGDFQVPLQYWVLTPWPGPGDNAQCQVLGDGHFQQPLLEHPCRPSGSANRTLGFIKRNVKSKPPKKTGNVISDPCISPASTIWDPTLKRTSTRLKLPRDVQPGRSWRITPLQQMSPLLHEFDWQTIEKGWTVACLCPLILRFYSPVNLRVMSSEVSLPYLIFLSP